MNVIELANHLRLEHLFITTEKQQLQKLNEKLSKFTEDAFHVSWIKQKQKCNLQNLIQQQQDNCDLNAIMVSNAIENVSFIDSYKRLSSQFQVYSDVLSHLRKNPKIIALSLIEIEQICHQNELQAISSSIFSSLFCDCILPEDQQLTLILLKELVNNQLIVSENPLKKIRNGNSSFKIFFKLFTESLIGCRFYLSSSLKEPIFNCLMEDELYLDLDPVRASMRYTEEEKLRIFGSPNDLENYQNKLIKFKQRVIDKLSILVINFIDGIQTNLHCLPLNLFTLFRHIYSKFQSVKANDEKEAGILSTELIFSQFICHAILNPELYGIVEINITKMARYNLTQIANIIQILALNKWQEADPKLHDLITKIPKKYCLKNFLQTFMQEQNSQSFNQTIFSNNFSSITNEIKRTCILFSENDLFHFLKMLFQVKNETKNQYLKKVLDEFLKNLNESLMEKSLNYCNNNLNKKNNLDKSSKNEDQEEEEEKSKNIRKSILNKVKRSSSKNLLSSNNSNNNLNSYNENFSNNIDNSNILNYNNLSLKNNNFQVLVIPIINNTHNSLCNDILTEEKILTKTNGIKMKNNLELNQNLITTSLVADSLNNFSFCELGDKTSNLNSRYSIDDSKRSKSQDQESIGTNDNLEAISEASSIENLNDNLLIEGDNLSDMISANVSSGRGSPNVSGRESSSGSQSDEEESTAQPNFLNQNEILNDNQVNFNNRPNSNRINNQLRSQEYIEDKFGKFDYKQVVSTQPLDETKSHLSDTWSTDVLASLSSVSLISSQLNDTNLPNQMTETINYEFCKKIFRYVFSIIDIQNIPLYFMGKPSSSTLSNINSLLNLLLAEAKYMDNLTQSIAIQEALRYLSNFDNALFDKMILELKDDYQKRSTYIAYLVKCKQNLISAIQHFETIKSYLNQEKTIINNCLITYYVRKFFMQNMRKIDNFVHKFKQLNLTDEKAHLIEEFLNELYLDMEKDADWKYTNEEQMSYGKIVVQRNIFSSIYFNALYPNGDGDILRDQIFYKHIQNLSKTITPDHKDLKIPRLHHNECPWPAAQEQIFKLNAYRTPKDKVNCVFNCCSVIMNLLSLCEKSVPAADDLIPVLVYVIIRANPPSLLSTIEFINTYHENKLEGEQAYWWTQFCSAVAFVKTMDY